MSFPDYFEEALNSLKKKLSSETAKTPREKYAERLEKNYQDIDPEKAYNVICSKNTEVDNPGRFIQSFVGAERYTLNERQLELINADYELEEIDDHLEFLEDEGYIWELPEKTEEGYSTFSLTDEGHWALEETGYLERYEDEIREESRSIVWSDDWDVDPPL